MPSTSGLNENATMTLATEENREVDIGMDEKENQGVGSDVGTSEDLMTGIMKIVPDVEVSYSLRALHYCKLLILQPPVYEHYINAVLLNAKQK